MRRFKLKPKAPESRFPKRRHKLYREFIKDHDCVVKTHARMPSGCYAKPGRYKVEFCHLKTQGSGGEDLGNGFPGCPGHHDEQEGKTEEFERRYGLTLSDVCADLLRSWEAQQLGDDTPGAA